MVVKAAECAMVDCCPAVITAGAGQRAHFEIRVCRRAALCDVAGNAAVGGHFHRPVRERHVIRKVRVSKRHRDVDGRRQWKIRSAHKSTGIQRSCGMRGRHQIDRRGLQLNAKVRSELRGRRVDILIRNLACERLLELPFSHHIHIGSISGEGLVEGRTAGLQRGHIASIMKSLMKILVSDQWPALVDVVSRVIFELYQAIAAEIIILFHDQVDKLTDKDGSGRPQGHEESNVIANGWCG